MSVRTTQVAAGRAHGEGGRRAETRRRLMASGIQLFARRGLHAVTSHEIAAIAGVAAGTFYLHFPDKRALFEEIAFDAARELRQRVDEATAGAADSAQATRRRAEELLAFAEEKRDLVRILFGRNADLASVGADVLDELIPWVERDLRARFTDASFEASVAAQAMVGMWARVLSWWAEAPGRAPREAVLETLRRLQFSSSGGTGQA